MLTGNHVASKIGFLLLCALLTSMTHASVIATVDRNSIQEFELVRLTIRISGGAPDNPPEFGGLEKDFEIVNTQSQSSSSISIVNGRQTSSVRTDYVLTLRARRLGRLIIPPVRVGSEVTSAIAIKVIAQTSQTTNRMSRLVFFDTSVDTTTTYVQGQILYTVKLFYSESISGDFPPPPKIADVVIETIESEKRYESIVSNRRYYVLEKRYAIFPQKSGVMTIPREAFLGSRGSGGLFSSRQRINAVSQRHVVTVKTIPAGFKGDNWIPAKQLDLSESWAISPPRFRVGEPINRTLAITANGLPASLLPPFADLDLVNAKTYADPPETIEQAAGDGIASTIMTTIGIVPIEAGQLTLPEITVPWWNTELDRLEVAIIPERSYEVLAAIGAVTVAPLPPVPVLQPATDAPLLPTAPNYAMAIIAILGLLLLVTSWQWWAARSRLAEALNKDHAAIETLADSLNENQAFKNLIAACRSNEAAKAHRCLFLWGKAKHPQIESISDLVRLIGREDFAPCLGSLEQQLYSTEKSSEDQRVAWQGDELLRVVTAIRGTKEQVAEKSMLIKSLNPA